MKQILLLIAIVVSICSCDVMGDADWQNLLDDFFHPPAPVVLDTCASYNSITDPAYIEGWTSCEFDFPWALTIGPFTDSIYVTDTIGTIIEDKIKNMLEAWRPQYPVDVKTSDDGHIINIMLKGTNVRENLFPDGWKQVSTRDETPGWIQLKCFIHVPGVRINFTFNERAMYYGGAVTLDEAIQYNDEYPSSKGVNARLLPVVDSLELDRFWKSYLNHVLCKSHAGARIDWRFNAFPVSDSLHTAFEDAGADIIE